MAQKKNGTKNNKAAGAVKKAPLPKKALGIPEGMESDIWKEAGVLEVILGEKESIDIEEMEVADEEAQAFMDELGAKSLFYVSFDPGMYEKALPVLKAIVAELGGKMLGDTPNLEPEIC